ncbi:hypothetical protein L3X38_022845 [Prunus dulcis]|uniref:HXXXD-type acyl-transferase family protein n=1 Tax=Prunus dulcis TaxID=3755 RepID=A0AAD4VZB0_PRUDU|nr:hypothetical protein L3X38_022845 [Prunus dulcis]
MATETKVQIIERQTIKPSSATPPHLRNFKLSFFDQTAIAIYIPILLYYPNTSSTSKVRTGHHDHAVAINERCQHLIESLSKTLTHFYPLAGRIIEGKAMVECNDAGAEFVKARINCSLSEILEHPYAQMLKEFLPIEYESKEASTSRLLLVQINCFECGGMAIGLTISHRIADASTLSTFIKCWATIAFGSRDSDRVLLVLPKFGAASMFPPIDFSNSTQPPAREVIKVENCITKRFVFDASKIAALQSESTSSVVPKPTRVEAVSALIWKCAMEASSRSKLGTERRSVFCQDVNLRKRVVPPLPENLVGNVVGSFTSTAEEGTIDLKDLVAKLREGIEELKEKYAKKLVFDSNEAWQGIKDKHTKLKNDDEMEIYSCTSWCRFPFYEADFGWGKPSWVSVISIAIKNTIVLMDKGDCNGIEAWLTMSQESMALFEINLELLGYASVNPSVITT